MSVDNWKGLQCNTCGPESNVFMRAKDLAAHKLDEHGPTQEQVEEAFKELYEGLASLVSNSYIAVTIKMYDQFADTHYYRYMLNALNNKVSKKVIGE
jgi:hypothetical protein